MIKQLAKSLRESRTSVRVKRKSVLVGEKLDLKTSFLHRELEQSMVENSLFGKVAMTYHGKKIIICFSAQTKPSLFIKYLQTTALLTVRQSTDS